MYVIYIEKKLKFYWEKKPQYNKGQSNKPKRTVLTGTIKLQDNNINQVTAAVQSNNKGVISKL